MEIEPHQPPLKLVDLLAPSPRQLVRRRVVAVDDGRGWESRDPKGNRPGPWMKVLEDTSGDDQAAALALLASMEKMMATANIPPIPNERQFKKEIVVKVGGSRTNQGVGLQTWALKELGRLNMRLYGFFCTGELAESAGQKIALFVVTYCVRNKQRNNLDRPAKAAIEEATKASWGNITFLLNDLKPNT